MKLKKNILLPVILMILFVIGFVILPKSSSVFAQTTQTTTTSQTDNSTYTYTYIVKSGDSLSSIASSQLGNADLWRKSII